MRDSKRDSNFYAIYEQNCNKMLPGVLTESENGALYLLTQAHGLDPKDILKQTNLDEKSNQKIADLYFLILVNTLIQCNQKQLTQVPFKLPEKELEAWPNNYSRNQFAEDLRLNESALRTSPIGTNVLDLAAGYASIYDNTVAEKPQQTSRKLKTTLSNGMDELRKDSLEFLHNVAKGFFDNSTKLSEQSKVSEKVAYGVGLFCRIALEGVLRLGAGLS